MRIKKILKLKVNITTLTGLHIGSGDSEVKIGGIDSPVIKIYTGPRKGQPYIPGSSLKGKLRNLMEIYGDNQGNTFEIDENIGLHVPNERCAKQCTVCRFFGAASSKEEYLKKIGPTRLLFRDLFLSEESMKAFEKAQKDIMDDFFEEKVEISINRLTGTAKGGGLRFIERVPADTKFEGELIFRLLDIDTWSEKDILDELEHLKGLIEKDCLGGNGSRGYGQIKFEYELQN